MKKHHSIYIAAIFLLFVSLPSCANRSSFDISTYKNEINKNNNHSFLVKTKNINQIRQNIKTSCGSDYFQIQYIKNYSSAYNVSYVCPINISHSENHHLNDLIKMTADIKDSMYFDVFGHELEGGFDQAWHAVSKSLLSQGLSFDLADKDEGVLATHFSVDIDYAVRYIIKLSSLSDKETFLAMRAYAYRTCMVMLDDSCPEQVAPVGRHNINLNAMEFLAVIQENLQLGDGEWQPNMDDLEPYSIFDRHQLVYESSVNLHGGRPTPSDSVVGSWSGMIDYPGFGTFPILMVIDQKNNGTIEYPTLNCSGKVKRAATKNSPEGKRLSQLLFVQTFEIGQLVCGKQYAFYLTPVGTNSETLLFECCTLDGLASARAILKPTVH